MNRWAASWTTLLLMKGVINPLASHAIFNAFYIDDILSGSALEGEAFELVNKLKKIMKNR